MKHVVVVAVLAVCAGSSFGKAPSSPACAALQSAKEAQAGGQPFDQYRVVTSEGEQVISTAQEAIDLWGPRCQQSQLEATAKAGRPGKAVAQKTAQAHPAAGG